MDLKGAALIGSPFFVCVLEGWLGEVGANHPVVFFKVGEDADDHVFADRVDVGECLLSIAEVCDGGFEHVLCLLEGAVVADELVLSGWDRGGIERGALADRGISEGDDSFGDLVGGVAGVVDDLIEELVDGLEVWALDVPVELFEVEGEVDACLDAWLEDLGLLVWVV